MKGHLFQKPATFFSKALSLSLDAAVHCAGEDRGGGGGGRCQTWPQEGREEHSGSDLCQEPLGLAKMNFTFHITILLF